MNPPFRNPFLRRPPRPQPKAKDKVMPFLLVETYGDVPIEAPKSVESHQQDKETGDEDSANNSKTLMDGATEDSSSAGGGGGPKSRATSEELEGVTKELEEYIESRRKAIEEQSFEKFYVMRLEQSRKFIELLRRVNRSWDDFLEYLKTVGSQNACGEGDGTAFSLTNGSTSLVALSELTE